jgi:hypothetical protein
MKKIVISALAVVMGMSILQAHKSDHKYQDYILYKQTTDNRFKPKENVIIDQKTGLMWQDSRSAKNIHKEWRTAQKYCRDLTLAGHNDWRLPTYDTMLDIMAYTKNGSRINPQFKNKTVGVYWTNSPSMSSAQHAWGIDFDKNVAIHGDKLNIYHVRCVRGGDLVGEEPCYDYSELYCKDKHFGDKWRASDESY